MNQEAVMWLIGLAGGLFVITRIHKALTVWFASEGKAGKFSLLVLSAAMLIALFLVFGPMVNK